MVPGAIILSCLTGFEPETASEWFVVRTRGGAVEHGQHVADEFVVLKIKLCARYYLSLRHKIIRTYPLVSKI